jgi:DNA-binding NarL/FixJ family response regulator
LRRATASKVRGLVPERVRRARRGAGVQGADIEVAGEAADGRQALDLIRELDPDVALMDIRMPILDGSRRRAGVTAGARARSDAHHLRPGRERP